MIKKAFIVFYIICVVFLNSCSVIPNITPSTAAEAKYYYKDDSIILAINTAKIGISHEFNSIEFFIQNISNKPLNMNGVYDVLTLESDGKEYQPGRFTSILEYPGILNPDSYSLIYFLSSVDISLIDSFEWQHNSGKVYNIEKR